MCVCARFQSPSGDRTSAPVCIAFRALLRLPMVRFCCWNGCV